MSAPKVFVSHSHRDRDWSRRLAKSLSSQGVKVSFSQSEGPAGAGVFSKIKRGVEQSSHVVTILDPKGMVRPSALLEAGMAVGLGKNVTFVVPETSVDLHPDLKFKHFVYRGTPEVTAKKIVGAWKLIRPERRVSGVRMAPKLQTRSRGAR